MKECSFEGCTNPVFSHGFCKIHQVYRLDEKYKVTKERRMIKRISEKKQKYMKKLHEQDKKFYLEIWGERPHVCSRCNISLPDEFNSIYTHHILEKSKYPEHRYNKDNISILCFDCHSQVHQTGGEPAWHKTLREQTMAVLESKNID